MLFNFDPAVVSAILALFGIGLVPIINWLKGLLGATDKPAVLLVLGCSAAGTAVVLLTSGGFAIVPMLVYTIAVFGEASGLYQMTKKPA